MDWPASLPNFLLEGLSYSPIGNAMAISPEVGEPLTRVRFTGRMADISPALLLTGEELAVFDAFWRTTLKNGSLRFNKPDPALGTSAEMLFLAPPRYVKAGSLWRVEMSIRVLG